ncbi:MAG: hypothetical protein MZV63_31895 [Marinilabiliales bacterium]|nr:hypothetical protein [Marinilabiliales bacterium]
MPSSQTDFDNVPGGEGCTHLVDPRDPDALYLPHVLRQPAAKRAQRQTAGKPNRSSTAIDENDPPHRGGMDRPLPVVLPQPGYHLPWTAIGLATHRDRGQTWKRISPDLTFNDPAKQGDISYQTITGLAESPLERQPYLCRN